MLIFEKIIIIYVVVFGIQICIFRLRIKLFYDNSDFLDSKKYQIGIKVIYI